MEELDWRAGTLEKAQRAVLLLGCGVAVLTIVIVVSRDATGLLSPSYLCMMGAFAGIGVLQWVSPPYRTRATVFVTLLVLMGWFSVLTFGLAPGPLVVACISTVSAGVFLGPRALFATLTANALERDRPRALDRAQRDTQGPWDCERRVELRVHDVHALLSHRRRGQLRGAQGGRQAQRFAGRGFASGG